MDISQILHLPLSGLIAYSLPFLVALMFIVFVHEFGHFIVARWCGVKVDAFSIGFGREIFGWFDRRGTRWKVCWIPLGGYVKFEGDTNATSLPDGTAQIGERGPGNFHGKAVWQRALVVAAGPIANFLLAIAIFACIFMFIGVQASPPRIDEVMPGSAAEQAGLKAGDLVVEIDGRTIQYFTDLQQKVMTSAGEELNLVVDRAGERKTMKVTPLVSEVDDGFSGKTRIGLLGVKHQSENDPKEFVRSGPIEAVGKSVDRTWFILATTMKYIGKLVTGNESSDQLGGPIAIAKGAGDAAQVGFGQFAVFIAFLSVSIGLINLFPVPMLDGGHLVFYGIEALRGKPLGPDAQEWSFRIGFSLVLMLMIVGTFNDVLRVITKVFGS